MGNQKRRLDKISANLSAKERSIAILDAVRRDDMATAISLEETTPRKSYRGPDGAVRQTINVVENLSLRFDRAFYGIDPISERAKRYATGALEAARAITFKDAAVNYIEAHKIGWRNAKHVNQWTSTLETYAYPVIGSVSVQDVSVGLVMRIPWRRCDHSGDILDRPNRAVGCRELCHPRYRGRGDRSPDHSSLG
jgi:hypothetical protein